MSAIDHGDFARYIIGANHPSTFPFSTRQRTEHATTRATSTEPNAHQGPFDTELVGRYVFLGVVDRGWTPERFGAIDDAHGGGHVAGRSSHKRERIGKKYQWQAWHEALARLSDNYVLRDGPDAAQATAAGVPFTRDFDPTHLLTGNPNIDMHEDNDNNDDEPWHDELADPWWLPLPEPDVPNLSTFDQQCTWVADQSALIDTAELVVLPGPVAAATATGQSLGLADTQDWVLLHATIAWNWDPYGRTDRLAIHGRWADHAVVHHTVLIRDVDVPAALDTSPERYDPFDYNQEFIDGPFLGEFPGQLAVLENLAQRGESAKWTTETGINAAVLLSTDRYVWEGNVYDCSLHGTVSVTLPSAALLDIVAPHARPRDGAMYRSDDQVIAFAPDVHEPGDSALLIRADLLHAELQASNLSLGRLVYQERRSGISHQHSPWPGMLTRTSLHIHRPTRYGWTTTGSIHHIETTLPRQGQNSEET